MARFKPGQKVVCRKKSATRIITKVDKYGVSRTAPVPQFNEIVTVDSYSDIHANSFTLVEYPYIPPGDILPCCFHERWFEPLMDITELQEILEQQPEMA